MLNLPRIRAITLDLDDTLWPVWPTIQRAESVLQQWLTLHAPATAHWLSDPERRQRIREAVNADLAHLSHDLTTLRREAIRRALVEAGDAADLCEPAFEVFLAERQRVAFFDDALSALDRLSRRFPVASVSNGNADVHRVGIGHHFQAVITAREVGYKKPDPRIFGLAADALGVPPEAVLHVGDDFELDVLGAHAAGMQTAWINRAGHPFPVVRQVRHVVICQTLTQLCDRLGLGGTDPASTTP